MMNKLFLGLICGVTIPALCNAGMVSPQRVLECLQTSTNSWETNISSEYGSESDSQFTKWVRIEKHIPLKKIIFLPRAMFKKDTILDRKANRLSHLISYFVGGSTLTFTMDGFDPPCEGVSCMRLGGKEGRVKDIPLTAFGMRNIEALWHIRNTLVFAFHSRAGDIGTRDVDFAFLDLTTGKWNFFFWDEESQLHYMRDWEGAEIGQYGDAIILKSSSGAILVSQKDKTWEPIDPKTGTAIKDPQELIAKAMPTENLLPVEELAKNIPELVSEIFKAANPELTELMGSEFQPNKILLYVENTPRVYYCFCVSKYKPAAWDERQSDAEVGCFLSPVQKPIKLTTLGFFRGAVGITDAYCFDASQDNVVTIREMDMTHGLSSGFHEYKVNPLQ